jgi:hypothetical protein
MSNAIGSPAPVIRPRVSRASSVNAAKWFYPASAVLLLALAFIGFGRFFLHGKAYPDRPIHPDIKLTVIAHGISMTAWLVLLIVQPMLIALRKHKLHMMLGKVGAVLALAILVLGVMTAIGSAKTTPAAALIWGLPPKQFMAVPFISVLAFAGFITLGIVYRKKPDIHRAMMFFGTMTAMSAAVSRIDPLNNLYLGTVWERWFGPFFLTFVLGVVLLAVRCALIRRFDRTFAYGLAGMIAIGVFIMNIAPTRAWEAFATVLVG